MADYSGWHDTVNGKSASYYYKRSKFWKFNYQVISKNNDVTFDNFYIKRVPENKKKELLNNAWSQNVTWSNLYKISFSEGWNPDDKLIETIKAISLKIILREIELLKPSRILFNTGKNLFACMALDKDNVFEYLKKGIFCIKVSMNTCREKNAK